jgi:hypothetical protein
LRELFAAIRVVRANTHAVVDGKPAVTPGKHPRSKLL